MCNLYNTILCALCTVQVRSDEVLLLQLQVSVRTPFSRQHRHRAARSSGALAPSQVAQPSPRSSDIGKAQIVDQIKFEFQNFANKSAERFFVLHKMAGRRTAVTSGTLRSPSPGLPAD